MTYLLIISLLISVALYFLGKNINDKYVIGSIGMVMGIVGILMTLILIFGRAFGLIKFIIP